MKQIRSFLHIGCVGLVLSAGAVAFAQTQIQLSTNSSDATPAADLDALLEFDVVGSVLTLTVTNQTPIGTGFNITELYFNTLGAVTGLTTNPPIAGWTDNTDVMADGFGVFDIVLIDGVNGNPETIMPQEVQVFTLDIAGTGPFNASQFSTGTSDLGFLAAAKFVTGPGDDSSFGATVPEPASFLLLAVGGLLLRRR